ncbi:MAG: type II 3-dehydroquinate dehydratase, partial [Oscillospiraceae bacterium]|nr:type II 3-dehydroquinate dehydratase [Oscillospiraceae bacterium]
AIRIPVIEVHISQTAARDEFRHVSVIGPVRKATIAGFGRDSYILGMDGLVRMLAEK